MAVQLPSSDWNWVYHEKSKTAICIAIENLPDGNIGIAKSLQIQSTSKASVHVGGQNVTLPGCDGRYEGYDDINRYLRILSNVKACKGFLNDAMGNVNVTGRCSITRNGQVLRSTSCRYIASPNSKTDLCRDCANCLRNLRKRVMQPKNIEISKRKLTTALQKIRRLKSREVVRS